MKEIVLPNGAFCRIRRITWDDVVSSYDQNPYLMFTTVAAKVIEIEGKHVSVEMLRLMPLDQVTPIINIVSDAISKAMKNRGVA